MRPDPEGELVWVPSPEAFEDFNDIIFGHRTIGIRTDDVLKHMAQNLYELGEAHIIGADVCDDVGEEPEEVTVDRMLRMLAWRVSERRGGRLAAGGAHPPEAIAGGVGGGWGWQ